MSKFKIDPCVDRSNVFASTELTFEEKGVYAVLVHNNGIQVFDVEDEYKWFKEDRETVDGCIRVLVEHGLLVAVEE